MPLLDVTEVLLDPDFVDLTLVCHRQVQTVDEDNFPINTPQDIPFSGVVTVDRSLEAKRMTAGQNTAQSSSLLSSGLRRVSPDWMLTQ